MAFPLELVRIGANSIGRVKALHNVGASGNGQWVEVSGYPRKSIHITGITTATVIISGSNEEAPLDTTHGGMLVTVTTDGFTVIDNACRWLKVRCSAFTSGTINAWVEVCT